MITGRFLYDDLAKDPHPLAPVSQLPDFDNISEQERADYRQTAKEVNEQIWQVRVDTLQNILGQSDGVKAYAQGEHGAMTIVTQFRNCQNTGFNWTCHDPHSNEYARFSMDFDAMAMLLDPDPAEPIWREWKEASEPETSQEVEDMPEPEEEQAPPISPEWGHIGLALALSFEEIMQQDPAPINREYCWHHDGPGMGGWCCAHPECRDDED